VSPRGCLRRYSNSTHRLPHSRQAVSGTCVRYSEHQVREWSARRTWERGTAIPQAGRAAVTDHPRSTALPRGAWPICAAESDARRNACKQEHLPVLALSTRERGGPPSLVGFCHEERHSRRVRVAHLS
jgi:hypothetical protein